jgi:predicted TIM-barrel fold metal-dependent hydrolase
VSLATEYFDCNAGFGWFAAPSLRPAPTAADLLAEMDACGIARALVTHAMQRDGSPEEGNRIVLDEIAGSERLEAAWVVLPPETGEFPPPAELAPRMAAAGVRALRLFPRTHRCLLTGEGLAGVLDQALERRIPLLLHEAEWDQVDALLQRRPALTLVVCAHGPKGDDRRFRPLLDHYQRLHVDTSRYEPAGGIEDLCRAAGPERILFGTNFPAGPIGGPRLMLDGADIPESARSMIASENLDRLLARADLS